MFQCIGCKPAVDEGDEQVRQIGRVTGTESGATNQAVKNLTSQFKEMALKITGGKQSKSMGEGSSNSRRGAQAYEYENNSEGVQGLGGGGNQAPRRNEPVAANAEEEEDSDDDIMWIAQVEPGVHITFAPLPTGGNDFRRIRFNRDLFDRSEAQEWWRMNFDRVMELYNVQLINRRPLNRPRNFEDELTVTPPISRQPSGHDSPVADWLNNGRAGITVDQGNNNQNQNMNAAETEDEWIDEVVPGVFLTIRQLPDGSKEIFRVNFNRERFGGGDVKKWWKDNKERIRAQYH